MSLLVAFLSGQVRADELNFESHVRPILREYCLDCHGATETVEGSLDLRLVRLIVKGGESGSALVAANPAASLLFQRVESGDMPPGEARVSPEKLDILRRWIEKGAKTKRNEPESLPAGIPITEEDRAYWAYQPIQVPNASVDPARREQRTPLDALIQQAMPSGLNFSADADRWVLIQRLFTDLVGLPPTADQLQKWLNEPASDWYEQLVDHLLSTPQYGERWGRHWLDAVGYSDSDGFTLADAERAWAWRYRDYVIRSLNNDKPFDRFITEQLAGDELAGPAIGDWTEQQIELLTATGFLRMAADGTGSGDNSAEARNKTIADTMQIVGSTLLASSLNCAQCHDHRYDPISHRDYFAVRAVFDPALDWQNWKTPGERLISLSTAADRQLSAELEVEANKIAAERNEKQTEYMKQALDKELTKYEEPLKAELRLAYETAADKRTAEQKSLLDKNPSVNISPGVLYQYLPNAAEDLKKYDQRIAEVRAKKPPESYVMALVEPAGHVPVTKLFYRGDHNQPKQEISAGKISVLTGSGIADPFPADDPSVPTSGRRLAFARWLTDKENPNPLFARAMVNRIWLHHFGRGIVATPGDFGKLGSQPTHPQVLDWLANYWIRNGWSLKMLHRIILTSTVYRQSSAKNATGDSIDPADNYYWHKPLMRVDAEVLRDSMLALSGDFDLKQFGPPIPIEEDDTGQVRIAANQPRRSVYAKSRRTQPVAMLQSFDAPVMQVNCDARTTSTVATQSLLLMNNDVVLDQAGKIAKKIMASTQSTTTPSTIATALVSNIQLPAPLEPMWRYGTGLINEQTQVVEQFLPLKHFSGSQWQGGTALPDAEIGWVLLSAQGGHPGNAAHPAIRRWIAPAAGQLTVQGTLGHGSEHGDGVRARVIVGSSAIGTWQAKQGSTPTETKPFAVEAGQAVDFVIDCIAHETSDSFTWPVTLILQLQDGNKQTFESTKGFQGPQDDYRSLPTQIILAWKTIMLREPTQPEFDVCLEFARQQLILLQHEAERIPSGSTATTQVLSSLCQTLLGSNEFLYIE
ncbi:MAG: PSD1 and planctomycete cytochrome C domain-containing protein [Pirellulales bacterium]